MEKTIKKTFEIETSAKIMERFERFLAMLHYNSAFGHSGLFAIPLDGDGNEKVCVNPKPRFKHEVDLTGGIGGDIEIAHDGGYTAKNINNLKSADWIVRPGAILYKDGKRHSAIPSSA